MRCVLFISILVLLNNCYYGVNKENSEIGSLNTDCIEKNAWNKITQIYSTENIVDSLFIKSLKTIQNRPFKTDVLYFENSPRELIGVSKDHYSVRYLFNPQISDQVLDGFSLKLGSIEQKRVMDRVQKILVKYRCESPATPSIQK